jgi:predicted alpha/beta hydrolase
MGEEHHTASARTVAFKARDAYPLSGQIYSPGPKMQAQFCILLSSGTGFPQTIYRRAAEHLAKRGAVVLTYDCRGIGGAAPEDLAALKRDYSDWGRLDMPAALDTLINAAPDLPVGHIAHSVGGHFAGFMDNHGQVKAHAFVAVGSGYWRDHPLWYNPLELYFWYVLGPYSLSRYGYLKQQAGWTGEPLPRGVFQTWRRWCLTRGYYAQELSDWPNPHHFDDVTSPIRSWVFSDDPIANARTAPQILDVYPNATASYAYRSAKDYGVRKIGHAGAFRPALLELWDEWYDWLHKIVKEKPNST